MSADVSATNSRKAPRHALAFIKIAGAILVFLFVSAGNTSANATTIDSGTYNNEPDGDGYDNHGTLIVESQPGSPGYPQFDDNSNAGLVNYGNHGGTATVSGGSFDNNDYGLFNYNYGAATVSGGSFDDNNDDGLYNDGGRATVSGGSFDDNNNAGLANSGTATVSGGSFDNNYEGLYNFSGTATVSGGSFDDNNYGLANDFGGTATVSGGSFDGNYVGLVNYGNHGGTAMVSGGSFDDNGYFGLDIVYGTVTVSGGSFGGNGYYGLCNGGGTVTVSGGSFGGNGEKDIYNGGGTVDIDGTGFTVGGADTFGDLGQGAGSLTWTQADGFVQTLTYDNVGGTIDLIQVPPAAAPEASSFLSFGILSAFGTLMAFRSRRRSSRRISS